jgi:hypothetical protein
MHTVRKSSLSLQQAFDAVWATLYAHVPPEDKVRSEELGIALGKTLVSLAAEGITDPQELRRRALENMALTP